MMFVADYNIIIIIF